MNPFYLLLFSFLAVSFSLILIQKEMRIWEKFCLLINPALLVLVLVMLMTKTLEERAGAQTLAHTVDVVAQITQQPGLPGAKETADTLERFSALPQKDADCGIGLFYKSKVFHTRAARAWLHRRFFEFRKSNIRKRSVRR